MKRLIFILTLFISVYSFGQLGHVGFGSAAGSGSTLSLNAEYQIIYDAMSPKPSAAVATAQNALVQTLVDSSYWTGFMDYLIIPATENESNALINWITPGTNDADNVDVTQWTQFEGYNGDGIADYISTNFNPSTDNTNFTLDDCAIGVYTRSDIVSSTYLILAEDGGDRLGINPESSGSTYYYANDDDFDLAAVTNSQGMYMSIRTDNANKSLHHFGGGASGQVSTAAEASRSIPNVEIDILLQTIGGPLYSTRQFSIFFLSKGMTAGQAIGLNGIFETYMDDPAINKGVQ